MALNGSDSEEELLAAFEALEKGGLVAAAAHEPPQSLQVMADGNFGGAASCSLNTMELPAVLANAGVDMDTSTTSSTSSASSSFSLEMPLFADVAESGEAAGTKRRRLTAKARDPYAGDDEPPAAQQDPNEQSDEHAGVEPPADAKVWQNKSTRAKRMFIGNRLRRMNWYGRFQSDANKKSHRTGNWPDKWTELTDTWKEKFVKWWAFHPDNTCGLAEKDWAVANFVHEQNQADDESKERKRRHRLKQVLLTYNGPWGQIAWQSAIPKTNDMNELTAALQNSKFCQQLWQKARLEATQISVRLEADDHAVCLEVCPRTLEESGAVRVHIHLALVRFTAPLDLSGKNADMLGSPPILAHGTSTRKGKSAAHSALYYAVVPKLGQLWSHSSSQPYKDFPVNAEWTWNLLQGDKLSPAAARDEFLKGNNML